MPGRKRRKSENKNQINELDRVSKLTSLLRSNSLPLQAGNIE